MNIALFTDTYYPQLNGVATSVLMLTNYLRAIGHRVYVFTSSDPGVKEPEEDVFRLPSLPFLAARRMSMFYHPGLARRMRRLDLDLIHTHTEFSLGVFGRHMARELDLPLIHTMHTIYEDYTHYITKFRFMDALAKTVAKKISADFCNSADLVIVPTEKVRDLMLSYGVARELTVVPTGIELARFRPGHYGGEALGRARQELGLGENEKILLYIGRLAEEKNIQALLTGLADYLPAAPGVRLLLIGDGPYRAALENQARELGLAERTVFAGQRPWDEIGLYYQLGDVFVNASQSESQGLTYIEAMAAGLPVVAKYDRCLDGVLQDGVSGRFFRDEAGLVAALQGILSDGTELARLSRGALAAADGFSAPGFADKVAAVYERRIREAARRVAS